jgi:hypothetical protein
MPGIACFFGISIYMHMGDNGSPIAMQFTEITPDPSPLKMPIHWRA